MSEIIEVNIAEQRTEDEREKIEQLKDLPESVRGLFEKLPDSVKNKIFPSTENRESINFSEDREKSLEEIVAGFDTKTREEFMTRCIGELFEHGRFKDTFEAVGEDDLKQKIGKLLDLLWQNRSKRDDVQLFNQEYYDNFFEARRNIAEDIDEKKSVIEKLRESIATTNKQKRLTERKTQELRLFETELNLLADKLNTYDHQHGNSDVDHMYSRDVLSRQRNEREWTKAATITNEYLSPAEFATVMAEQLDRTFYREASIVKDPARKWFGRSLSEHAVERAQKVIDAVTNAIEEWHIAHESDHSFKKPAEMKFEERQGKLIDYLRALMGSYLRGKEAKGTDEEMIYTIRQMEVALYILGR